MTDAYHANYCNEDVIEKTEDYLEKEEIDDVIVERGKERINNDNEEIEIVFEREDEENNTARISKDSEISSSIEEQSEPELRCSMRTSRPPERLMFQQLVESMEKRIMSEFGVRL